MVRVGKIVTFKYILNLLLIGSKNMDVSGIAGLCQTPLNCFSQTVFSLTTLSDQIFQSIILCPCFQAPLMMAQMLNFINASCLAPFQACGM